MSLKTSSNDTDSMGVDEKLFLFPGKMWQTVTKFLIILYVIPFVFVSIYLEEVADTFLLDAMLIVLIVAIAGIAIYTRLKLSNPLSKMKSEYVNTKYFIATQTFSPEGKDSLEKIMNLCKAVFPTVKRSMLKNKGM